MKTLASMLLVLGFLGTADAQAGAKRPPAEQVEKVFAKLDLDHDGRISRQEGQAGPKLSRRFDLLDENKDGFVSKAELLAAIERHRAKQD